MKIQAKLQINKPASEVWQVLGRDFDKAQDWMSIVPKSYESHACEIVDGAPIAGRVCEFNDKGFKAQESITFFDDKNFRMKVNVLPENAPKALPMKENNLEILVKSLGENKSEVYWISEPILKSGGKILSPLVKLGLKKAFVDLLEELKFYVENGKPHPRKQKKLDKQLAVA